MKRALLFLLLLCNINIVAKTKIPEINEISGIEILLASGSDASINTKYGHTFIRLLDHDDIWSNDTVMSFGYEVIPNQNKLDAIKEILKTTYGEFPLVMNVTTLGQLWTRYEVNENRNIHRHIVPTNQTIRNEISNTLKEWKNSPNLLGGYTVLSNNCIGKLEELLKRSGVPLRVTSIVKPMSIHKYLVESNVSFMAPVKFNSKENILREFGLSEHKRHIFSKEEFQKILKNYSDHELKQLLAFNIKLNLSMIRKIRTSRGVYLNKKSFDKLVGIKKLPQSIYENCGDHSLCIEEKIQLLELSLGSSYIEELKDSLNMIKTTFKKKVKRKIRAKLRYQSTPFHKVDSPYSPEYLREFQIAKKILLDK